MKAISSDCIAVARRLIEAGADINLQNASGNSALMNAVLNRNEEAVKLLIEKNANLNLQNNKGETAYIIACKMNETNIQKSLSHKLKSSNEHDNLNEQRVLLKLKLLAHAIDQSGKVKIGEMADFDLEGGESEYWLKKWAKSTAQLPSSALPSDLQLQLQELLDSHKNSTPAELLLAIKADRPRIIHSGFKEHAVAVLIWKDRLIICNRGAVNTGSPIKAYKFNPQKLTAEVIETLQQCANQSGEEYLNLFFRELPNTLELRADSETALLQKECKLPMQTVGNCSWTNPEAAVWALIQLHEIDKWKAENNLDAFQSSTADRSFAAWKIHTQLYNLEKLIQRDIVNRSGSRSHTIDQIVLDSLNTIANNIKQLQAGALQEGMMKQWCTIQRSRL
jgi:hypothetical protein